MQPSPPLLTKREKKDLLNYENRLLFLLLLDHIIVVIKIKLLIFPLLELREREKEGKREGEKEEKERRREGEKGRREKERRTEERKKRENKRMFRKILREKEKSQRKRDLKDQQERQYPQVLPIFPFL